MSIVNVILSVALLLGHVLLCIIYLLLFTISLLKTFHSYLYLTSFVTISVNQSISAV